MNEQDQRAIETMIGIGLEMEELVRLFPQFKPSDILAVFNHMKGYEQAEEESTMQMRMNCS